MTTSAPVALGKSWKKVFQFLAAKRLTLNLADRYASHLRARTRALWAKTQTSSFKRRRRMISFRLPVLACFVAVALVVAEASAQAPKGAARRWEAGLPVGEYSQVNLR